MMIFDNEWQHTLANLKRVEGALSAGPISSDKALHITSFLAAQGHPLAEKLIEVIRERVKHREALAYLDMIGRVDVEVRRHVMLETLSREAMAELYEREGFIFEPSVQKSKKLLVMFLTMFNNFHVSAAALLPMVRPLGCNVLLLRDSSYLNYQHGVKGLASNIPGIGDAISNMAHKNGCNDVYITGFSSCGYAALYVSLLMQCSGYLGFSQPVDMSGEVGLPTPPFFSEELRKYVGPKYLTDLKPLMMADTKTPRKFVYGERSALDRVHIEYLSDLMHIEKMPMCNVHHNTVENLIADGEFMNLLSLLISQ